MLVSLQKATLATEILGVKLEGLTPEAINSAYRQKAKECHPDHHPDKIKEWANVSWAKEVLTVWVEHHPPEPQSDASEPDLAKGDCRACGGEGRIKVGTGFSKYTMQCLMCRGEGTVTQQEIDND